MSWHCKALQSVVVCACRLHKLHEAELHGVSIHSCHANLQARQVSLLTWRSTVV